MGRPIKKKWFAVKSGSTAGDLQVTTTAGAQVILAQKGTGKYLVADDGSGNPGIVKLIDGAPTNVGEAQLQHDGKNVKKMNQYRVYYFDGSESAIWRTKDGSISGVLNPAPVGEPSPTPATGVVVLGDSDSDGNDDNVVDITITDGGYGYANGPVGVTITGDGTGATATATASGGAVTSVTITNPGSGYTNATVTFDAP